MDKSSKVIVSKCIYKDKYYAFKENTIRHKYDNFRTEFGLQRLKEGLEEY